MCCTNALKSQKNKNLHNSYVWWTYYHSKNAVEFQFKESFKTALCGAIENGSFRSHHKKKKKKKTFRSSFALILPLFCWWKWHPSRGFLGYTCKRYMAFPEQNTWILRSFNLNSVLTRQTAEKVACKSGFDNPLECFLPSTFARISNVLPEKFQKFL